MPLRMPPRNGAARTKPFPTPCASPSPAALTVTGNDSEINTQTSERAWDVTKCPNRTAIFIKLPKNGTTVTVRMIEISMKYTTSNVFLPTLSAIQV